MKMMMRMKIVLGDREEVSTGWGAPANFTKQAVVVVVVAAKISLLL